MDWLPEINASLNGLACTFLILGKLAIKSGKKIVHKRFMLAALTASLLFLVGYAIRVFTSGTHVFPELGFIKTFYLVLLGSHTLLAVVNLPLVVVSVYWAMKKEYAKHRKIVRFTWPIWTYVSATGLLVYFMLYQLAPRLMA